MLPFGFTILASTSSPSCSQMLLSETTEAICNNSLNLIINHSVTHCIVGLLGGSNGYIYYYISGIRNSHQPWGRIQTAVLCHSHGWYHTISCHRGAHQRCSRCSCGHRRGRGTGTGHRWSFHLVLLQWLDYGGNTTVTVYFWSGCLVSAYYHVMSLEFRCFTLQRSVNL